jgi:hypothetical protein
MSLPLPAQATKVSGVGGQGNEAVLCWKRVSGRACENAGNVGTHAAWEGPMILFSKQRVLEGYWPRHVLQRVD